MSHIHIPTHTAITPATPVATASHSTTGTVCFASDEFACVSDTYTEVGASLMLQARALLRAGVRVRLLYVTDSDSHSHAHSYSHSCGQHTADFDTLATNFLYTIDSHKTLRLPVAGGKRSPFLTRAAALLQWLLSSTGGRGVEESKRSRGVEEENERERRVEEEKRHCDVLHVADRSGLGVFVSQAKRAGVRALAHTHINIQTFGVRRLLEAEHKPFEVNVLDLFREAAERLAIEFSDSVSFWSLPQAAEYRRVYVLPVSV